MTKFHESSKHCVCGHSTYSHASTTGECLLEGCECKNHSYCDCRSRKILKNLVDSLGEFFEGKHASSNNIVNACFTYAFAEAAYSHISYNSLLDFVANLLDSYRKVEEKQMEKSINKITDDISKSMGAAKARGESFDEWANKE